MTFLEEYMELHPDADPSFVVDTRCPSVELLPDNYNSCLHLEVSYSCKECWNGQMPEEVKKDDVS